LGYTSDQVQIPNENFAWALFFWRAFERNGKEDLAAIQQQVRQFTKAWKMSNKAQKDILAYLDILIYRAQAAEWTLVDLYGRDRDQLVLVEGLSKHSKQLVKKDLKLFSNSQKSKLFRTYLTNYRFNHYVI